MTASAEAWLSRTVSVADVRPELPSTTDARLIETWGFVVGTVPGAMVIVVGSFSEPFAFAAITKKVQVPAAVGIPDSTPVRPSDSPGGTVDEGSSCVHVVESRKD